MAAKKIITLDERELEETFSRSGGNGGQNVNKVSTKVVLRHVPTNISVIAQDSRSQAMNRKLARERLLAALNERRVEAAQEKIWAREKVRRQKSQKPKFLKAEMVTQKRKRARTKSQRNFRSGGDD